MNRAEFEKVVGGLVPSPDIDTTNTWASICLDAQDDAQDDFLQDMVDSLTFVKNYFNDDIAQAVYDIAKHGNNILPWELISAAILLADGEKPENLSDDDGANLICFKAPAGINSPIACVTFIWCGKEASFFTICSNSFDAVKWRNAALDKAKKEIGGRAVEPEELWAMVRNIMLLMDTEYEVSEYLGGRILADAGDTKLSRAVKNIWGRYNAVVTHIYVNLDGDGDIWITHRRPK